MTIADAQSVPAKVDTCCGDPNQCPVDYRQCPFGGIPPQAAVPTNYVILPVTPNDAMLLDVAVVTQWEVDNEEGGCSERDFAYEGYELLVKHGIPVPDHVVACFNNTSTKDLGETLEHFFADKDMTAQGNNANEFLDSDDMALLAELQSLLGLEDKVLPCTVLQFAITRIKRLNHEIELLKQSQTTA